MKRYLILLLVTFIPLAFVFFPFFHDGFFPTMDDVQVVRIEEMYKELVSGQFPVRIVSDLGNGAGYMLFQFYSPLVYYIGTLFHLLGFTLVISTKLTFLSGFILAWIGIVLLLREYFDEYSTFFGSVLFFGSSYMGYDVFHRGALAEFYALAILPLLFFLIIKFSKTLSSFYFLASSFAIAALVIIHNLTTLITFPFILITIFLLFRKKLIYGFWAVFLGITLSAFYWLPVVFENKYIVINQVDFVINTYKNHFLTLSQLVGFEKAPWGFIAPILGVTTFLGAVFAALLLLVGQRLKFIKSNPSAFIIFSLISFIFTLFMASDISQHVWDPVSPILRYIQFPWRFLTLATFFGVISCTLLLSKISPLPLKLLIGLLLIIPLFTIQYTYLRPKEYNYISKYTADDPCGTAGWSNEYIPVWAKECRPKGDKLKPVNIIDGELKIKNLEVKNHARLYTFTTSGEGTILFDKYYFPGWETKINGELVSSLPSTPHGLIALEIPPGEHTISLVFTNTSIRTISNIISLLAFVSSMGLFIKLVKKNIRQH
ncbi:hypothetical protein C4577_00960 [Candidatus Parcubacteria bacterium]|nr:MAG: hypothetical protein C4577_00960 [Candidatus Parcubacteria bacterium]